MSGASYCNSKLSTYIHCERNNYSAFLIFQEINKKKKIFLTYFKPCKLQIIHGVTYIDLFLSNSNKWFFIYLVLLIHIFHCYFLILYFFLTFFFLVFFSWDILRFIMFDSISSQLVCNITKTKNKYFIVYNKRKSVNYNQNKCSNIIIFGANCKFFLPSNQLAFFLAFGQAKRFFTYHILMNILSSSYFLCSYSLHIIDFVTKKNLLIIFHNESYHWNANNIPK